MTLINDSFTLTDQFKSALEIINQGKSIFITGQAGTGKSTFLEYLKNQVLGDDFVYLAPTGVAAVNIQGATIHSFFRFNPKTTVATVKESIKKLLKKRNGFKKLKGIVIDEVSMVSAELLDCIDLTLKALTQDPRPFGGKQMIFIGDLYQLPPVIKSSEQKIFQQLYETPYFFSARVFQTFDCEFIEFEHIFRQKDPEFIKLLNQVRVAEVNSNTLEKLNQQVLLPKEIAELKDFVFLTPFKKVAAEINHKRLEHLNTPQYCYQAELFGQMKPSDLPVPVELCLKVGARVMLVKNDPKRRFVNGSLGTVVELDEDYVVVKLDDGKEVELEPVRFSLYQYTYDAKQKKYVKEEVGWGFQLPLILAWSITIHKSQGKTLNKVVVDLRRGMFAPGQFYVAISRATNLKQLFFTKKIKPNYIFNDWRAIKLLVEFQYQKAKQETPLDRTRKLIRQAIKAKKPLKITYLKPSGHKSKRSITPLELDTFEYAGKEFEGVYAYCHLRQAERVFKLERITQIQLDEESLP